MKSEIIDNGLAIYVRAHMLGSFAVFISHIYTFILLTDTATYQFKDSSRSISNKLQAGLCAYVPCKH